MKTLVTYFSATCVTERVAERLAAAIGAELFEIKPKEPYTRADLNWMDKKSRSTLEMQDRACRPEIKETLPNMADFDTVFVGFPIWWYREPSIIDTFMEQYDFTGKTVIPFATSGGSGLGDSAANMQALAPGAKLLGGKRFRENVRREELAAWVKELEL